MRAASISFFTFNQGESRGGVVVEGKGPDPDTPNVDHNVVGPGYFVTMGIPLLLGRLLGPQDTATSPKVAVINETMAKEFFPGSSPLGRRFSIEGDPKHVYYEVVGVVKDAKYVDLQEEPQAADYYPYTQNIDHYYSDLEVRYFGDPQSIIAEVRHTVGEVDRRLPLTYQNTLAQQVDQSVASQSLIARLSAFFGLLAAFLACIGIYGLMSYSVNRRRGEIGIRIALGAGSLAVLRMVIEESLIPVGLGLLIGPPVAVGAERLVSSMLFGLGAVDPLSMAAASALLVAFALAAAYLPARRASRVDSMEALRYE